MHGYSVRRRLSVALLSTGALGACILIPTAARASFTDTTGTTVDLAAGTFTTYQESVADDGPLGYYQLDDTAGAGQVADGSGQANPADLVHIGRYWQRPGSPAGGSDTGQAINLPGATTGGYLSSTDQIDLSSNIATTFELWISTTGNNGTIAELADVSEGTPGSTDRVLRLSGGALEFEAMGVTLGSATVNDGNWHLVHTVLAPGVVELWVDGALADSDTFTGSPAMTGGYVRVGGDTSWFDGNLDAVAVYHAALPQARIEDRWNSGAARTAAAYTSSVESDSPWALWNLDDTPTGPWGQDDTDYPVDLADSSSAGHPAIARNLPPYVGQLGLTGALSGSSPGTAMRMDGSGWGRSTGSATIGTGYAAEMWINTTTTTGGVLSVLTDQANSTCHVGGGSCDRMTFMTNDGHVRFGIQPASTFQGVVSNSSLNDGEWHYVVSTIAVTGGGSTAQIRLYVDNVLQDTTTVGTPADFTGYFAFAGGGLPSSSNVTWPDSASFTGKIDEIAYYDKTLSASTIGEHWQAEDRT